MVPYLIHFEGVCCGGAGAAGDRGRRGPVGSGHPGTGAGRRGTTGDVRPPGGGGGAARPGGGGGGGWGGGRGGWRGWRAAGPRVIWICARRGYNWIRARRPG